MDEVNIICLALSNKQQVNSGHPFISPLWILAGRMVQQSGESREEGTRTLTSSPRVRTKILGLLACFDASSPSSHISQTAVANLVPSWLKEMEEMGE